MKFTIDERVKHRLTGLVVILAIAAIFLPAIMKKSNQRFEENVSISVRLPAKPEAPQVSIKSEKSMFQSVKVAHVDLPKVMDTVKPHQIARAEPINTRSEVPSVLPKKAAPMIAKVETVVKPALKAASSPNKTIKSLASKKGAYAVQLASFTQQSNAQLLVTRLRHKGYQASYNKFSGKKGEYYQVIVGQLKEREAAKNLQKKLLASTQLNGFIIKTGVS